MALRADISPGTEEEQAGRATLEPSKHRVCFTSHLLYFPRGFLHLPVLQLCPAGRTLAGEDALVEADSMAQQSPHRNQGHLRRFSLLQPRTPAPASTSSRLHSLTSNSKIAGENVLLYGARSSWRTFVATRRVTYGTWSPAILGRTRNSIAPLGRCGPIVRSRESRQEGRSSKSPVDDWRLQSPDPKRWGLRCRVVEVRNR